MKVLNEYTSWSWLVMIWINEGEELYAITDTDGNGYKDDK